MLVLVGAGAVTIMGKSTTPVAADVIVAALAHGLILVSIIATYGHISGAHVNPAVTFGLLVGPQITVTRAVSYWIGQVAGGMRAALVMRYLLPDVGTLGQIVAVANINGMQ